MGPAVMHRRWGNNWADTLAKAGAALHPDRPQCRVRAAQMTGILREVLPFFGRALASLVDRDFLPKRPDPTGLVRIPRLSPHVVVEFGEEGAERCCKCLRFGRAGKVPGSCLPSGTRQHSLYELGGGIFCSTCAAYSFSRTRMLASACTGFPDSKSSAMVRLNRLLSGRHPHNRRLLGTSRPLWAGFLDVS